MSTAVIVMVLVIMDTLSETTVHIAGDAAVAVGAGYTWAVDVSFRRMNRPPPLGGLGGERGLDVVLAMNHTKPSHGLRKAAVDRPGLPGLEGPQRPGKWRTRWA